MMNDETGPPIDIDALIKEKAESQRAPFYAWIRFLVTLATSVVVISVSVQNLSRLPISGERRTLLLLSWGLLTASVVSGILRAAGEFHDHRRTRDNLLAMRRSNALPQEIREYMSGGSTGSGGTKIERATGWICAISFVLGMCSLLAFGLMMKSP